MLASVAPSPRKQVAEKLSAMQVATKDTRAATNEPILTPNPKRFVLFPINYHDVRFMSP
jgi:hypothetical protein